MITYRLEKGAPLTILEIDNNFRELEQRLKTVEDQNFDANLRVEQKEDVLVFHCNFQEIAQVILPKFQPIFKGMWKANCNYHIGCWIYLNQKLYTCKTPHTSGTEFENTFWQLIFDGAKHDA